MFVSLSSAAGLPMLVSLSFAAGFNPTDEEMAFMLLTSGPTSTTTGIFGGLFYTTEDAVRGVQEWYENTLYAADEDCLAKIRQSEVSYFIIANFEQIRQEQFYVDKPFTEALAELTAIPTADIEAVLAANLSEESSVKFLSIIMQTMSKDIMDSDASHEQKIAALTEILVMDVELAKAIDNNDTDKLLLQLAVNSDIH
jgi:hypothetical protein